MAASGTSSPPKARARTGRAELVGGPLDGMLLDVTGWDPQEVVDGAMLMSEHGRFGPGGRSEYEPADADPGAGGVSRFVWRGDVP
ncbi:hypothetical protein AB0N28_22200 [Streptomyces sp. NPDC051130]|uniref:hypothetical protein n=1 Tax=Streptomyces sp. NPDC051130 TaxID=3157223 RepID=UPI00343B426F